MYDGIIIVGPTASGKTSLSIKLAKRIKSEIINADSMYIYKDLDIGTAKPTVQEMNGITHHLINLVEANETMNVSIYREHAVGVINEFKRKKIIPIITGGTGFYIDSLISNYSYGCVTHNEDLRHSIENDYDNLGGEILHQRLKEIDNLSAEKIHPNDKVRLVRALELCLSGTTKSNIENNSEPIIKSPLVIGLDIPRDILYERINKRVDKMLDDGLIDEVKRLIDRGLSPDIHQSMKGIGYKEIYEYLCGNTSLEFAIDKIKQHTRNYAKRQLTWFRSKNYINWINGCLNHDEIVELIYDKIKNQLTE
ncbi:MAG: tRNA (adenosine(37)-N6)-dimethylallyltransferase MiaA [Clostridiales bacterium]|nr:tRNA (adenosine(37)-N6)-dimethylallyltransferase MiaA [Clostridiales bacterium]